MSIKDKITIAESGLFNGIAKAAIYYSISEKLIKKWIDKLDYLRISQKRAEEKRNKKNKAAYLELTEEQKKKKNKYKAVTAKKYYSKHVFHTLRKNLIRNLKSKGYEAKNIPSKIDLWSLAKRQKCLCAISGLKLTSNDISIDHIIPLSKGGTSNISNLQLVNKKINLIKHDMSLCELLKMCEIIIKHNKT